MKLMQVMTVAGDSSDTEREGPAVSQTSIEKNRITEICTLHAEVAALWKASLMKAIRIGQLLSEQKAKLEHGEWEPWMQKNLPFSGRTARRYMGVYANRELIAKTDSVSDLNEAYGLLAAPKRGLLEQSNDSTEKALWVFHNMATTAAEIGEMLMPLPGHYIAGLAEDDVVFWIEHEDRDLMLRVARFKEDRIISNKEHLIKIKSVKAPGVCCHFDKHIGIGRIRAIWNDKNVELTATEMGALGKAYCTGGPEAVWAAAREITEPQMRGFDSEAFIEDALSLHERLMASWARLCEAYTAYYGTPAAAG